jgi:hypothetical protein
MTLRDHIQPRDKDGRPLGQVTPNGGWWGTAADLVESVPVPSDWGPWRFDRERYVLYSTDARYYEIGLEDFTTSAEVLDTIAQISHKSWAGNASVGGLVQAIDDLLHLQRNLCSSGKSKRLTPAKIRRLADEAMDERELGERIFADVLPIDWPELHDLANIPTYT